MTSYPNTYCDGLNCVPLNFICWSPTPQYLRMCMSRWGERGLRMKSTWWQLDIEFLSSLRNYEDRNVSCLASQCVVLCMATHGKSSYNYQQTNILPNLKQQQCLFWSWICDLSKAHTESWTLLHSMWFSWDSRRPGSYQAHSLTDLGTDVCGWLGVWLELSRWVIHMAWVSLQHGDWLWGEGYKRGPGRGLTFSNQP